MAVRKWLTTEVGPTEASRDTFPLVARSLAAAVPDTAVLDLDMERKEIEQEVGFYLGWGERRGRCYPV
jgi:hypothetical protein